jgi:matrixin
MHELQHTLGLDHSSPTKSIMGFYSWTSHHGPWSGDIADVRALYPF